MMPQNLYSRFKQTISTFFNLDKTIICSLLLLALINIIVQYSANDKAFNRLLSDMVYLGISFSLLIIISNIGINQIKNLAAPFYILCLLLLIGVIFFGVSSHGGKRWLNIGIRIQPSELCKLAVPLLLAYYFSICEKKLHVGNFVIAAILIIIPFGLIVRQPDLGTATLVVAAGFFVMFFAGLSWRLVITGLIAFISLTPIIWHFLHDYQKHRLLTMLNPQSDPLGKGYHIIQAIIAIGSGGIYGKGYLHGTQSHLDFIPEKHTDFVISVIAEEFGFIGVFIVLMLYMILILRILKIMQHTEGVFEKLFISGYILSFTLYVVINAGMVAGILPVVGVPLPIISYGGTATIVLMLGFGIILSIARESKY